MIRAVGWLDTWALSSTLYGRYRPKLQEVGGGLSLFVVDPRTMEEWRQLKSALARLTAAVTKAVGFRPTVERVTIARLEPRSTTSWAAEPDSSTIRLHVALVANPNARRFVADTGEAVALGVGVVNLIDQTRLNSWVNLGDSAAVELVIDLLKPVETDEPDAAD